jgi:hypothetical protein
MSDVMEQLKQLAKETVVEEEVEVSWIVSQEKLSDDEKMIKLKELASYVQSEEFKSLVSKFSEKVIEVQKEIRKIAFKREEAKVIKSILDEYVVAYGATEEIQKETTCETYKNYLASRMEALESAILKKRGIVERGDMAINFDMPIFTEIDLLKEKATIYNSVEQFLKYCISIYDFKGIMERKNKNEDQNPHQPY